MVVDFWYYVSVRWSHKVDVREYEKERKITSIIGSYVSDIPDELYEDNYDDDDDDF